MLQITEQSNKRAQTHTYTQTWSAENLLRYLPHQWSRLAVPYWIESTVVSFTTSQCVQNKNKTSLSVEINQWTRSEPHCVCCQLLSQIYPIRKDQSYAVTKHSRPFFVRREPVMGIRSRWTGCIFCCNHVVEIQLFKHQFLITGSALQGQTESVAPPCTLGLLLCWHDNHSSSLG